MHRRKNTNQKQLFDYILDDGLDGVDSLLETRQSKKTQLVSVLLMWKMSTETV